MLVYSRFVALVFLFSCLIGCWVIGRMFGALDVGVYLLGWFTVLTLLLLYGISDDLLGSLVLW
jgi:hypothetical protein